MAHQPPSDGESASSRLRGAIGTGRSPFHAIPDERAPSVEGGRPLA